MADLPKKKKVRSRIRQTPTDFQKAFKNHQHLVGHFAWRPLIPEFIHIAVALLENDYSIVKKDFITIADHVNQTSDKDFHFTLSHTVNLLQEDKSLFKVIEETCFGPVIQTICTFYPFKIPLTSSKEFAYKPELLIPAYKRLLDGRSDMSILCKYMMLQYHHRENQDPLNLFKLESSDQILSPAYRQQIFTLFPPSTGQSDNFDLDFTNEIWLYNYCKIPFIPPPDMTNIEEARFKEVKMGEFAKDLENLYQSFKEVNLLLVFSREVAEANMGFVARICNLTLDVIEFEKNHKAEIAELTARTILETYIVANWLNKHKDPAKWQRFRSFSIGKDRSMVEKLTKMAADTSMADEAAKIKKNIFDEMGSNHINVAEERGDIFDMKLDQMAEDVWGKDNIFYFQYKRYSDVIHGHWRVITKYHLAKSLNPMQAELYSYNENENRFAGLVPSFICLEMATNIMITVLSQITDTAVDELKERLDDFNNRRNQVWLNYYDKYIKLSES